ncbi:MAG: OmpA family protein [Betaproteobacteria bacterium]|nr:OmpA family protein [Betaproteobacteria bacterium]
MIGNLSRFKLKKSLAGFAALSLLAPVASHANVMPGQWLFDGYTRPTTDGRGSLCVSTGGTSYGFDSTTCDKTAVETRARRAAQAARATEAADAAAESKARARALAQATLPGGQTDFRVRDATGAKVADGRGDACIRDGSSTAPSGDCSADALQGSRGDQAAIAAKEAADARAAETASFLEQRSNLPVAPGSDLAPGEKGAYVMRSFGSAAGTEIRDGYGRSCIKDGLWTPGTATQECDPNLFSAWAKAHPPTAPAELAGRVKMAPPDVTGAFVPDPNGPVQPDDGPGVAPPPEKVAVQKPIIDNSTPDFPITKYEYDPGIPPGTPHPVGDDEYPDARPFIEDTYEEDTTPMVPQVALQSGRSAIPPGTAHPVGDDEYPDAQPFVEDEPYDDATTPFVTAMDAKKEDEIPPAHPHEITDDEYPDAQPFVEDTFEEDVAGPAALAALPEEPTEAPAPAQPPELANRVHMPPPDVTAAYVPDANGPAQPDDGPGIAPPPEKVAVQKPIIDNSTPDFPITKYEYDPGIPPATPHPVGDDEYPDAQPFVEDTYEEDTTPVVAMKAPAPHRDAIPPSTPHPVGDDEYPDAQPFVEDTYEEDTTPMVAMEAPAPHRDAIPPAPEPKQEDDFATDDHWPPADEPYTDVTTPDMILSQADRTLPDRTPAVSPEVECPPVTIQMEPGRFEFDKWHLRPQLLEKLDEIAEKLKSAKCEAINIVGHTDRIGSRAYNQKLSERRANAAKEYLVKKHGIDPTLISTAGRGETSPVTKLSDCRGKRKKALIACYAPDRRIEVTVRIKGQDMTKSK